jgi:phosphopantothenoylcysteine decarboxylase/phosphopantothenate--cysteine ligase
MGLIALGVTGGIGAYKAVEIVRRLQQNGHDIVVIMTSNARRFVGPLTFEAITRRPVIVDQFAPGANATIEHVSLATDIQVLLVAPATANTIGKLAHGIADDFLTSLYLVTRAPVVIAPAMNTNMYEHPAVAGNLEALRARGAHVVAPGEGYLACGWTGPGRLASVEDVVAAVEGRLRPAGDLAGRCILVSAGPTYEDLDPVRFVGNRSSGRMGFALAAEAAGRGARVVLVAGPCRLEPPAGAEVVPVRSAADMHAAVMRGAVEADAVIMAAAVADYTPGDGPRPQKIAKESETITLTLTRTTDILAALGRWRGGRLRPVLIGFAAETRDVVERARAKLEAKGVDLIVANDVSGTDAGFDAETNAATLVAPGGTTDVPLQSKRDVARVIVDRLRSMLFERETPDAVRNADHEPS